MRELTLLDLNHHFVTKGLTMSQLREEHSKELASRLVEASENISKVYLLQANSNRPGVIRMWVEELDFDKRLRLPFNKPSGSQSAAIGPVLKRTYKSKDHPPYGPSTKIQKTTRKAFQELAESKEDWAAYFQEVCRILFEANTLEYRGKTFAIGNDDPDVLATAIRLIGDQKETVFLSVVDAKNRWPGDRAEYQAYLAYVLAEIKYTTVEAPACKATVCPLCDQTATTLFPNASKGAGINFSNVDRAGAFPNLDVKQAWKSYGLC